mgnify:CR=1 FL=1
MLSQSTSAKGVRSGQARTWEMVASSHRGTIEFNAFGLTYRPSYEDKPGLWPPADSTARLRCTNSSGITDSERVGHHALQRGEVARGDSQLELADEVVDRGGGCGRRLRGYRRPVSYTHLTLPTNREV